MSRSFGEIIRDRRIEFGISPEFFCKKVRMIRATLKNYEDNNAPPADFPERGWELLALRRWADYRLKALGYYGVAKINRVDPNDYFSWSLPRFKITYGFTNDELDGVLRSTTIENLDFVCCGEKVADYEPDYCLIGDE